MAWIQGTWRSEDIDGTSYDDTLEGFGGDDEIWGYSGHDDLYGDSGDDILVGGSGDDNLDGGTGWDEMEGGTGDDYYYVDSTGDLVIEYAGEGIDSVYTLLSTYTLGANLEDLLYEGSADFTGTGNAADNYIYGNVGDDVLDGGLGNDRMAGELGDDTYYVDDAGDVAFELAGEGRDIVFTSLAALTLAANVEEMIYDGSGAFKGAGNGLDNYIESSAGADTLDGQAGNDELYGLGGNDMLIGGTGADHMYGGAGNDVYVVDNSGDKAIETSAADGTDLVKSSISWTLGENLERLTLTGTNSANATGNGLNNILTGNEASNVLDGGAGADVMQGGGGNDIYVVDNASDKAVETSATGGTDQVNSSVSYTLAAYVERLVLTGTGAINGIGNDRANRITGNGASNNLYGLAGSDTLDGGAGADMLFGGIGNDTLKGSTGADRFVFNSALNGSTNVDTIVDFSVPDDTISLSRAVFSGISSTGTLSASAFHTGTSAHDADDRIVYDSASGKIFYDADGNGAGAAMLFAQITAGTALTNLDFTVIA